MTFIPKRLRFFQHKLADYNSENKDMEPRGPEADDDVEYNLVSSLCTDGLHHPCLDIDEDVGLRVVESSTPGHYHLYFDNLALSWTVYSQLLSDLTRVGIVDSKWVAHSQRKGMTTLRPPHVKKNPREVEVWNNSDPFGKTSKEERLIDDFDTPWGF